MWICRHCAAHVNEEVLECPCCAAPAPAQLVSELANHVPESPDQSVKESRPLFLLNRLLPNVEKQGQRRSVEIGFLLGVLLPLIVGIAIWVTRIREQPSLGNFFALLPILLICLVPGLLLGLLGGVVFGTLHFAFVGFGDFLFWLFGRERDSRLRLPRRSALAKTDAMGRRRRKRKSKNKQTGIVDLSHPDGNAVVEGKLDITPEDAET